MGKLIMVASLKGGVGKTTLTASLASKLSDAGYKTLAVDMDFGIRSLDIALGHENTAGPDCYDVITGKVSLPVASVQTPAHPNLFFLSAPMRVDPQSEGFYLPQNLMDAFLKEAKRTFDFVFLDMSAGSGTLLTKVLRSGLVTTALAVCTHNTASIRATEKLASSLFDAGIEDIRLVINSFLTFRAKQEEGEGVVDIINRSSVSLLGVIPFDAGVEELVSHGTPLTSAKNCLAGQACSNIAKRLLGENVPLFKDVLPKKSRLKLY